MLIPHTTSCGGYNVVYNGINLAKMKDTTETVCKRNSSETAQQNFLKLCSCEGQTM